MAGGGGNGVGGREVLGTASLAGSWEGMESIRGGASQEAKKASQLKSSGVLEFH